MIREFSARHAPQFPASENELCQLLPRSLLHVLLVSGHVGCKGLESLLESVKKSLRDDVWSQLCVRLRKDTPEIDGSLAGDGVDISLGLVLEIFEDVEDSIERETLWGGGMGGHGRLLP